MITLQKNPFSLDSSMIEIGESKDMHLPLNIGNLFLKNLLFCDKKCWTTALFSLFYMGKLWYMWNKPSINFLNISKTHIIKAHLYTTNKLTCYDIKYYWSHNSTLLRNMCRKVKFITQHDRYTAISKFVEKKCNRIFSKNTKLFLINIYYSPSGEET